MQMYLTKNRIRVIKRQEREQQRPQEMELPDEEPGTEGNIDEANQRTPASTVKEWVNDFLRRRQHSFQEDV